MENNEKNIEDRKPEQVEVSSPPAVLEPSKEKLVEIRDLRTYFFTDAGVVTSVDGVSYDIYKGETLGLVGESGCGKSVTALSIMRLVPDPPGKIVNGEILFKGQDLTGFTNKEMRKIRGNQIGMKFP